MVSPQGEALALCRTFSPAYADGALEKWGAELESMQQDTVKECIAKAVAEAAEDDVVAWAVRLPCQVACIASQIRHTAVVRSPPVNC